LSGDKVTGITPGTEISDDDADDLYIELQAVISRYAGRVSNAEAIGMLAMLVTKVYLDTHPELFDRFDGAS
jgi:hypothetical protein